MTPNLWILSPFNFLLLCLVAFLETSLFFLLLLVCLFWAWVRPSAGHHVTNRAVLQRVFQSWLVWIQGIDWHAGLSRHTGRGTLAAKPVWPGVARQPRTGLWKTMAMVVAWSKFSFLTPLPWTSWQFITSWPAPPRITNSNIAQIKITTSPILMMKHRLRVLEVDY